jgi:hypothetical protein
MKNVFLLIFFFVLALTALQVLRGQSSFEGDLRRGDVTADDWVDLTDAIETLTFLFIGGRPPECWDAADSNDDGKTTITDAIYTLTYLFIDGPPPPPPFLERGHDPTPDDLPCPAKPGLEWKPGSDSLTYRLTYRHFKDDVLDEMENRNMTYSFEDDGTVRASGASFAFFGERYEFDRARLIATSETSPILPGDATWLTVPAGVSDVQPGVMVRQAYPEEFGPDVVVLQNLANYEITAVNDATVAYSVTHSVQIADTPALAELLDFLTPSDRSPEDLLAKLGGFVSGAPVAVCEVVFDRDRGAISRMECVSVFGALEGEWTVEDLRAHPDRTLVSIILD